MRADISLIKFEVKDSNDNWNVIERDGNNYLFNEEYIITIVNCNDYPALNNLTINLDGINTDSDGEFTVFIPSGNY